MDFCPISIIFLLFCFTAVFSTGSEEPSHISINCGSGVTSAAHNGREWIGDRDSKFTSSPQTQLKGIPTSSSSTNKLTSSDPAIYRTARISKSPFFYSFHFNPGPIILRFHFNPAAYKGFKSFSDLFDVEAGQFTLLGNFSASLTAQALGVSTFTKEFYLSITENQPLNIAFSPSFSASHDRTYAFINGIEIVSIPTHLTYFQGGDLGAQVVGQKSGVYVDKNTALESIHRLNVKRDSASQDDSDLFEMWDTVTRHNANEINKLTWTRCVNLGFKYLIRVHFSNLGLKIAETGHLNFNVQINGIIIDRIPT